MAEHATPMDVLVEHGPENKSPPFTVANSPSTFTKKRVSEGLYGRDHLNFPFWGNQTMQLYGDLDGFPLW